METILGNVIDFGSFAVSFSLSPDGMGMDLISTSDNTWTAKIIDVALIMMYIQAYEQEEQQEHEHHEEHETMPEVMPEGQEEE